MSSTTSTSTFSGAVRSGYSDSAFWKSSQNLSRDPYANNTGIPRADTPRRYSTKFELTPLAAGAVRASDCPSFFWNRLVMRPNRFLTIRAIPARCCFSRRRFQAVGLASCLRYQLSG